MADYDTQKSSLGDLLICQNDLYKLESGLGSGGMGKVYLAKRMSDGKKVAIKIAGKGAGYQAIEHEAAILADLGQTPLNRLIERTETLTGERCLILEFIDGQSLEKLLAKRQLSVLESLSIAAQAAELLALAHSKGVVHMDIKPANIIVQQTNAGLRVRLIDFGSSSSGRVRQPNSGSLAYMSPEQLCDQEITPKSDIYQLGLVLFECLHGRLPFDKKDEDAIEYRFVGKLLPGWVPKSFVWQALNCLLEKLLSRKPANRLASTKLLNALKIISHNVQSASLAA